MLLSYALFSTLPKKYLLVELIQLIDTAWQTDRWTVRGVPGAQQPGWVPLLCAAASHAAVAALPQN